MQILEALAAHPERNVADESASDALAMCTRLNRHDVDLRRILVVLFDGQEAYDPIRCHGQESGKRVDLLDVPHNGGFGF